MSYTKRADFRKEKVSRTTLLFVSSDKSTPTSVIMAHGYQELWAVATME